jgi:5-methylcytosine-specific restriction endonuclease McrA
MIGSHFPTRDHIRPKSKGYTLADPANRAIVCEPCNENKGSRSLASFAFRLRRAEDPRACFVEAFISQLQDLPSNR